MNSLHKALLTLLVFIIFNSSAAAAGTRKKASAPDNTLAVIAISSSIAGAGFFGHRAYRQAERMDELRSLTRELPKDRRLEELYNQARRACYKELALFATALAIGITGALFYEKNTSPNKPVKRRIMPFNEVQVAIRQTPLAVNRAPEAASLSSAAPAPEPTIPPLQDLIPNLNEAVAIARKVTASPDFSTVTLEELETFGKMWREPDTHTLVYSLHQAAQGMPSDATTLCMAMTHLVALRRDIITLVWQYKRSQPIDTEKVVATYRRLPKIEAFTQGLGAVHPAMARDFRQYIDEFKKILTSIKVE